MIIITGASRGVGRFLFEEYELLGENVYGTYNNSIPETTKEKAIYSQVNIINYEEVEKWIKKIGVIKDVTLINCAGISYNAFTDSSGGRHDSFTLAIGHTFEGTQVIDFLRGWRPPFDPAHRRGSA